MERNHGTHQDRLVKKLRRKKIQSYEAANEYLESEYSEYLAEHNQRFARAAASGQDYHRQRPSWKELDEVFEQETWRAFVYRLAGLLYNISYGFCCKPLLAISGGPAVLGSGQPTVGGRRNGKRFHCHHRPMFQFGLKPRGRVSNNLHHCRCIQALPPQSNYGRRCRTGNRKNRVKVGVKRHRGVLSNTPRSARISAGHRRLYYLPTSSR